MDDSYCPSLDTALASPPLLPGRQCPNIPFVGREASHIKCHPATGDGLDADEGEACNKQAVVQMTYVQVMAFPRTLTGMAIG